MPSPSPELDRTQLVEMLQRGNVRAWNQIRSSHIRVPSLAGINLRNAVLSNANFSGVDLTRADLQGSVLDGCSFKGARLDEADLRNAVDAWPAIEGASIVRMKVSNVLYWQLPDDLQVIVDLVDRVEGEPRAFTQRVQVWLEHDNPSQSVIEGLKAAVARVMDVAGFDLASDEPPRRGSWLKDFFFRAREHVTGVQAEKVLNDVEEALRTKALGIPSARESRELAAAVATLLKAIPPDQEACLRIGKAVVVKYRVDGLMKTVASTVSPQLTRELDESPQLLEPRRLIEFLARRQDQQRPLKPLDGDDEVGRARAAQ